MSDDVRVTLREMRALAQAWGALDGVTVTVDADGVECYWEAGDTEVAVLYWETADGWNGTLSWTTNRAGSGRDEGVVEFGDAGTEGADQWLRLVRGLFRSELVWLVSGRRWRRSKVEIDGTSVSGPRVEPASWEERYVLVPNLTDEAAQRRGERT
ncbi:MAG: hypothetical protein QM708_12600 [Propioniciclava sp.]|uniref:hypothetical protein n=1 Tax=Propioniciclava sp. TaxID=2038686 RepID=UPI0039E43A7D